MKRIIVVDRDGTIIREPEDEQVDSLEKLEFVPGAISALKVLRSLDYELVMATNQDGLGTPLFPEETFWPAHHRMLSTLEGEGVSFDDILIDKSLPEDGSPSRKPGVGMFSKYLSGEYDLRNSWVIGDRETDAMLAGNLGARSLTISDSMGWKEIAERIRMSSRCARIDRTTRETDIHLTLDLDGKSSESHIDTGLKFLDHMLSQIVHHGGVSLCLTCKGDLDVDEHHTMEDVGIALGEAIRTTLGDKRGIQRYGFVLPMDESRATVLIDFGGRTYFEWNVNFTREYVGDVPTEMFRHFFQSICNECRCNLHIEAQGENNHHIAEAIFKAFARALKMAAGRDASKYELPSSKGVL